MKLDKEVEKDQREEKEIPHRTNIRGTGDKKKIKKTKNLLHMLNLKSPGLDLIQGFIDLHNRITIQLKKYMGNGDILQGTMKVSSY